MLYFLNKNGDTVAKAFDVSTTIEMVQLTDKKFSVRNFSYKSSTEVSDVLKVVNSSEEVLGNFLILNLLDVKSSNDGPVATRVVLEKVT